MKAEKTHMKTTQDIFVRVVLYRNSLPRVIPKFFLSH